METKIINHILTSQVLYTKFLFACVQYSEKDSFPINTLIKQAHSELYNLGLVGKLTLQSFTQTKAGLYKACQTTISFPLFKQLISEGK